MEILTFAGIPITVGASEAVHRQRLYDEEAEAPERQEEFYLDVFCDASSRKKDEVHGAIVVLEGGKVRLWPKDPKTGLPRPRKSKRGIDDGSEGEGEQNEDEDEEDQESPHPFTGFYLPFPPEDLPHRPIPYVPTLGLVSTIPPPRTSPAGGRGGAVESDPPTPTPPPNSKSQSKSNSPIPPKPKLNWLYIDRQTRELKYGPRNEAKKHIVGPWDWTDDDEQGLTLDGEECLVAVEEASGGYGWAVYWDEKDDRLKGVEGVRGKRVLRCSLERRLVVEKELKGLNED